MPNVLSARHLARIGGGLLYAATSNVPWATLLARTFEVDVKACARCGGRLEVRAVVTDHDIARRILDAMPAAARAPPSRRLDRRLRTCVRVTDREPMASCVLCPMFGHHFGRLPPARPPECSPRAPSSQPLRATVSYAPPVSVRALVSIAASQELVVLARKIAHGRRHATDHDLNACLDPHRSRILPRDLW